jgi:hypothetical protein
MDFIMANIIDFDDFKKTEKTERNSENHSHSHEELGTAIQTLIQQLRKEPLKRIG